MGEVLSRGGFSLPRSFRACSFGVAIKRVIQKDAQGLTEKIHPPHHPIARSRETIRKPSKIP